MFSNIKRGLASLFVCSIVFLPVLFVARWPKEVKTTNQPADTRSVTALPPLATRPADLNGAPKLFQEPIISITFDDGWESIYTEAAPLLTRYGVRSTQYVIGGVQGNMAYMNLEQVKHLQNSGQEIACHTMTHPDLTTLSNDSLVHELHDCQTVLSKDLGLIREFASPYGHSDTRTLPVIKQYYRSHRNTDGDITNGVNQFDVNTPAQFDTYNIIGVTIRHDTTVEQLKAAVAYAKANNGWLVLTYHQADDETGSTFAVDHNSLQEQLAYLAGTDVKIAPMGQVLDSYNGTRR
jgi:peptidoglycan/xylan/chitin deacetylase (PgdA/CDA1 family)